MKLRTATLGSIALASACHVPDPAATELADETRGAALFARHCAVCHGIDGRGDGEAARFLFPPARDFGAGRFRLVSSENGAPLERDVVAVLRRGVPGSAMPAWSWLAREELDALARHVLALAEQGLRADLEEGARESGDDLLLREAPRIARGRLTPTPALPPPLEVRDASALVRGRQLFLDQCAVCHGEDGRSTSEPRVDEDGTLNWARDLTAGFLKGGDSPAALACRVRAGMPGTAMPPTDVGREDEAALLAHLRTLIPPGSAERLVHRRATLRARRVEHAPELPDDALWSGAEEIEVVLAPLRWNADAVLAARLAAVHDGVHASLRLTWEDATGLGRLFVDPAPVDASALQLSAAARPALFGMGAPDEPTNLWHWQARRLTDVAGALDLLDTVPHALHPTRPGEVRADVPLYRRILDETAPSERAERIEAEGLETITRAERKSGEVGARARWQDGRWSVVFRRALAATTPGEIPLRTGSPVQVACAVWNGAAGDQGAQKSISIWQELVLAP